VHALGHWTDEKKAKSPEKAGEAKHNERAAVFHPVAKGPYLQLSETDPTIVGLQFQGKWMIAVSGGKPSAVASATVGTLKAEKDVDVVEMQAAAPSDKGWKLQGDLVGLLIQGAATAPKAVGEIGRKASGGWQLHGKHGSKDKLPANLESSLHDDDQVELQGMTAPAVWMTYPVAKEKENPGGWATTGHDKAQVAERIAAFKKDAASLPEPLRSQVLGHIEAIAVVSSIEGSYSATSGQIADSSGSLGVFQWASSRNPGAATDSIDRFFARMKRRAEAGVAKEKSKQQLAPDEALAMKAWKQAQEHGIGVDEHSVHATIRHGQTTQRAGGLDLELAMADSKGLGDSYQTYEALSASRSVDKSLANLRDKKPKEESTEEEKKQELKLVDRVVQQLAAAAKDILASDLVADPEHKNIKVKTDVESILAKLAPKQEKTATMLQGDKESPSSNASSSTSLPVHTAGPSETVVPPEPAHLAGPTAAKDAKKPDPVAELTQQIHDKVQLVHEADKVLRPIIDLKIRSAPGMSTKEMKEYQLAAALDTLKEMQSKPVYLQYESFLPDLFPGTKTKDTSVDLNVGGRTLHLSHNGLATVGDFLTSEKAVAEMAVLGVNRPAYVATALWKALQPADVGERVPTLAKQIFAIVDKIEDAKRSSSDHGKLPGSQDAKSSAHKEPAKKTSLQMSDVEAALLAAPPEMQSEALAARQVLDSLIDIFWPSSGDIDEAQLLVHFRQEAMRVYNTLESKDASDNNRVGRFVTVEMVNWEAVDAVKAHN
jgi:hypothetical protein